MLYVWEKNAGTVRLVSQVQEVRQAIDSVDLGDLGFQGPHLPGQMDGGVRIVSWSELIEFFVIRLGSWLFLMQWYLMNEGLQRGSRRQK